MFNLAKRLAFWYGANRIGPDIPLTHWLLYFKDLGFKLCQKKFGHFGYDSEFRPGSYAEACSNIFIGDNVVIRPGSFLYADPALVGGSIRIESNVLLGNAVHLYATSHNFTNPNLPISEQGFSNALQVDNSILIESGCWIGSGVIILRGVKIGKNSVIAAGSLVNRSIPEHSLAGGVPSQIIRKLKQGPE